MKLLIDAIWELLITLIFRPLSYLALFLWRWKIVGKAPNVKQYVLIIAPHRQGLGDVFRGLFVKTIIKMPVTKTLMKNEIMKIWGIGTFLRFVGGVSVDRHHNLGGAAKGELMRELIALYKKYPSLAIVITPEGTRKNVPWLDGFYQLAVGADVPIIPVTFDYPTRRVVIGDPVQTSGKKDYDFETIRKWYLKHATHYYPKFKQE